MWLFIVAFLLTTESRGCTEKASASNLIQFKSGDFYASLHAGKTMFVFFERYGSPTISLFLEELEKSAGVLKDYGVLVGKVNCKKEVVKRYCTDETLLDTAVFFRGGHVLFFSLDPVLDVNYIVSEVLKVILRDEIKYVQMDGELMMKEKAAIGRKDIVVGYVHSPGSPEHRSLMETAYVYGSIYRFVLISAGPVLKYLGTESPNRSQVWFLHCQDHEESTNTLASDRCPFTRMSKPLTTLHLHSFLQLMHDPLVTEVYADPSTFQPLPVLHQLTPQVFLFSHPETAHLDMDTATSLAWKLRGLALVMLVHRESPEVKTSYEYNVAFRFPEKSPEVKYLTLQNPNEVLKIFTNQEEEGGDKVVEEEEQEEEEEEEEEEDEYNDQLDDEVARVVYQGHGLIPDVDSITQLTPDNFHDAVAQRSLTVVLFYFQWDAVSSFFFGSYVEVAERFVDSDVQISSVSCEEWTLLCAAQSENSQPLPFQPVTHFPSILLLRPGEPAQVYTDMLDAEALFRFIVLSQKAAPFKASTQEEISSFLREVPSQIAGSNLERVLGLFKTQTDAGVSVFTEAASSLRGKVLSALGTDELAEKWAAECSVALPGVFVFPSWRTHTPTVLPMSKSTEELLSHINTALLHLLPELTVENLPSFLSLGKALLLLFLGEEKDNSGQNQKLLEEMKGVVELGQRQMERYLTSWIHLGRTPAARSVLSSYFGSMPSLPTLVLTRLPSGDEVYLYPPDTPIVAASILGWLQRVEDGSELPAGTLGDGSWTPAFEFVDFLKLMDVEEKEERVEEEEFVSSSSAEIPDQDPSFHTEL